MTDKIKVGITHGDTNSISYEVIIKALKDPRVFESFSSVLFGSSKIAAYHRKVLKIENFSFNQVNSASEINPKRANIINCVQNNVKVELGKNSNQAGEAAHIALETAVDAINNKEIDAIVTAPINKENIKSEDFVFNGHTEYFESKFEGKALMFMISDSLKLGFVTNHRPIKEVSEKLSIDGIVEKLEIMNESLKKDFNISIPKIAVLGLNPHSGERGVIGNEEIEIINPAIEKAKEKGVIAFGPFPADGFFGSDAYKKYDAVLAMYHDQGMLPFKMLSFDKGVNYTAGLNVVRTSPAHGTAYDIVGQNKASKDSMLNAIYLAVDIVKNRKNNTK
jgi:4-hydroxythreonine-4-phosphate dehydrogenase